ncbi:hypothetical protein MKK68_06325 [Methylobacterium sp. E-016]|uniref:hypothetical protein n=1 Tax=Methylobacterium sp. E-016 TaxID=2836556 RepID=UPI001FB8A3F0|nr:hypothetical protein [Methylobacterium sp. E-016]MCJ2075275.1 hypothetical protein [Methylobacterium sp. E-016]
MTPAPPRPRYQQIFFAGGRGLIAVPLLAESLARPAYRPVLQAISQLTFLKRLERWIATKPRWLILAVIAVPFLGVEPLKVVGLLWIGEGLILRGVGLLAFAYGASFVLVERIYHAGRDKLRTYHWLAVSLDFVTGIRDAVLANLRKTRAWQMAETTARAAAHSARASLHWMKAQMQRIRRPRQA